MSADDAQFRALTQAETATRADDGGDIAAARNDASVLPFRRRLDARSFDPVKLRGLDLMSLASRIAGTFVDHFVPERSSRSLRMISTSGS